MRSLYRRKISFLVLGVLIVGIFFYLKYGEFYSTNSKVIHVSKYAAEAKYVEESVAKFKNTDKLEVENVFGGIISHHIPTAFPLLAEFYSKLKNTKDIKTFIILGPDHWEKGIGDVSISEADFITPFGKLSSDLAMVKKLEESRFAIHDETPFDDHSIHSQLLFISKVFPKAKVVAIVFRSSTSTESAEKMGNLIASLAGPDTFVVGSVDFSHYLNEEVARPLDKRSANLLTSLNPRLAGLARADSPASLAALTAATVKMGANTSIPVGSGTFNSAEYSNIKDFTTGYVVQFFASKKNNEGLDNNSATMFFVGDIMLSRSVGALMQRKADYNFPFIKIANIISKADISFANLENPVSLGGVNTGSKYSFRADPKIIQGLVYAGFDVVNIANNHIWDYGREAFQDTLKHIKDAELNYIGGGSNFEEAHAGTTKDVKGTKVSFLGYTDLISSQVSATKELAGISFLNLDQMVKDIKEAKNKSDLVVVSFHWGEEYQTKHNQKQEETAKTAIDAGASLVIGHHPHVVQEVEQYKDGWIAYSLGNFIFDQNFSWETTHGLALEVVIINKKIDKVIKKEITISEQYQASFEE